ncbi:ferritin family protein [Candidatus Margulisiibacteriota bacterium]
MTTTTALQEAIKFEEQGVILYSALMKKVQDPLSKKLFGSLAIQEKDHINLINDFSQNKIFKTMPYDPLEQLMQAAYKETKDAAQKKDLSNIEGYDLALQLEDRGFKMYQKALGSATDEEEKKFFKFLMDMEKEHYESLANIYYFLTDNDKWLAENESQTWNWMNF